MKALFMRMDTSNTSATTYHTILLWSARLCGIFMSAFFLLLLTVTLTGEDKIEPGAVPLLIGMGVTILGNLLSWRKQRSGGLVLILGSLILSVAVYISFIAFNLAQHIGGMSWLIYLFYLCAFALPPLIIGVLLLLSYRPAR